MWVSRTTAAALAVVAACFRPDAPRGLACSTELSCPSGQRCVTDEPTPPRCEDALYDSAVGPDNDFAEHAIDVSSGGAFEFDLSNARDDAAPACAAGGPDVFYRLSLAAPEVVYLDTFGSAFDTTVAVTSGDCSSAGTPEQCIDNSCGTAQSQGAWTLPAGDHCIIVDGPAGAGAGGKLVVVRGRHAGDPLTAATGSVTGNTCNDDNSNNANCGCEPANDHHYYFTVCPDVMMSTHAETCGGASWDTVLQFRTGAYGGLGCIDDSCGDTGASTLTRTMAGPGLFWVIIDGCEDCGAYTLSYRLAPTTP